MNYDGDYLIVDEDWNPKTNSYDRIGSNDLSYNQIVDQVKQNNAWSAEQAEKQMDFQRSLFDEANEFNKREAEINRDFQQQSADEAMAFSSAEATKNRNWQKMMSDTAHQREMADLKAAGLNPILAANNGASAGTGSAALSAQAAGYGASSVGAPSGSKGDTDESGTMAIANLLGKMLDNQTEITKMITSAETARETAEMYTGATRYAAELGQIASDIASQRSYEASRYGSYMNYEAMMSDPMRVLGEQLGDVIGSLNKNGYSAVNLLGLGNSNPLQEFNDKAQSKLGSLVDKAKAVIRRFKTDSTKHKSGKF